MIPNALVLGLSNREASPLKFSIAVLEKQVVELDDIICVHTNRPDTNELVRFYGVVDGVTTSLEGLSFPSDTEDFSGGLLPARLAYIAHVQVVRIVPEAYFPPMPGDPVFLCKADNGMLAEIAEALHFDQMENRIPAGLLRNGSPYYLNFDFINGSKGGHVNISGVAGVAAKTSCGLFLLNAIFNSGVLGSDKPNTRAILFNVKGEDLFFIDKGNKKLTDQDRVKYASLDLPAEPFQSVSFWASPRPESPDKPNLEQRLEGVNPYVWSIRQFCRDGLISFLFSDEDLDRGNISLVLSLVSAELRDLALEPENDGGNIYKGAHLVVPTYDHGGTTKTEVQTYSELVSFIRWKLLDDKDSAWIGGNTDGTLKAFLRRLRGIQEDVSHLIRGDQPAEHLKKYYLDPTKLDTHFTVIDINKLSGKAQKFVVGVILSQVFKFKEGTGRNPTYFIFLDELNKYAPREGRGPIKTLLVDIAERGRSLGVILIGAQQSASRVDEQVISQASIRIAGRLDGAEAQKAEYRFLNGASSERSLLLTPGSLFVSQPEVPAALMVQLPMPCYATRKEEQVEDESKKETNKKRLLR